MSMLKRSICVILMLFAMLFPMFMFDFESFRFNGLAWLSVLMTILPILVTGLISDSKREVVRKFAPAFYYAFFAFEYYIVAAICTYPIMQDIQMSVNFLRASVILFLIALALGIIRNKLYNFTHKE